MNNSALAPKPLGIDAVPETYRTTHGLHARLDKQPLEITIITGGLSKGAQYPHQARLLPSAPSFKTPRTTFIQLHQSAQGITFNLTKRERTFALLTALLFSAISFTIALL